VASSSGSSRTSQLPLCRHPGDAHHEHWHCQIDDQHAFFHEGYKYCWFADDGRELLFDAQQDPGDVDDRSADTALRHRLRAAFAAYLQSIDHPHQHDGQLVVLDMQAIDSGNVMGWMGLISSCCSAPKHYWRNCRNRHGTAIGICCTTGSPAPRT